MVSDYPAESDSLKNAVIENKPAYLIFVISLKACVL